MLRPLAPVGFGLPKALVDDLLHAGVKLIRILRGSAPSKAARLPPVLSPALSASGGRCRVRIGCGFLSGVLSDSAAPFPSMRHGASPSSGDTLPYTTWASGFARLPPRRRGRPCVVSPVGAPPPSPPSNSVRFSWSNPLCFVHFLFLPFMVFPKEPAGFRTPCGSPAMISIAHPFPISPRLHAARKNISVTGPLAPPLCGYRLESIR